MSANTTLNLTSLDFDTLKQNYINFAKANTVFKDANFAGSNINVLIDILSYNTYLNSFYLNMVATEMFMDSAQKLDSVVSHSKELNYLPLSSKSAVANVSFSVLTSGISSPLTIPKGFFFSGQNSNGNFSFTTDQSYNFVSTNSTFFVNNLAIYQGTYVSDVFIMDYTNPNQQFVLSNQKIDTSSLTVTVTENNTNSNFTFATNLYNLNSNSNVVFVQAAQDGKYEILFGDNLFGRIPFNSSLITVSYRITEGSGGNGISLFSAYQNLGSLNGGTAKVGSINVISSSVGGADPQGIESIRFYAPRYFAAQERAVSSDDFSSLILSKFGGVIQDVTVYGGELLNPKKYGTTAVCLKPSGGTIAPNYVKNQVVNYLLDLTIIPGKVQITDPDYFYCSVNTSIEYSSVQTTLTAVDISTEVLNSMISYFNQNVASFNNDFRYSKFVAAIDNSDVSVLSNDTQVSMIKRIYPIVNVNTTYNINYNNPGLQTTYSYKLANLPAADNAPIFYSSIFTYISNGVTYPNCILRDDNYGNIVVFNQFNNVISEINANIGTVNYTTGVVQINNLTIGEFVGDYISLYFTLQNKDIDISQNQILLLDPNDVNITVNST